MDSDTKTWNLLYVLLAQDDWDQTVYIYRVDRSGRTITPFLAKWPMHSDLIEHIRDDFGAGEYNLMIRQGKTMLFIGSVFAVNRNHDFYSTELATAVKAWMALFADGSFKPEGKTIRQRIELWLNARRFGLEDHAEQRIATLVNPDTEKGGGSPRTPTQ